MDLEANSQFEMKRYIQRFGTLRNCLSVWKNSRHFLASQNKVIFSVIGVCYFHVLKQILDTWLHQNLCTIRNGLSKYFKARN